ncbi:MAG: carbohydrate ABC transporter permease [Anaerolineae bacterium]
MRSRLGLKGSVRLRSRPVWVEAFYGYLFISPVLIGLVLFILGPLIASAVLSFTNTTMVSATQFIGLANYRSLLQEDDLFWRAMRVSFTYAVVTVPISTALQLILATALNRGLRGVSLFRVLFYLPSITPSVAIALLWVFIYNPQFGLANFLLDMVGLPRQMWLASSKTALPSLMIMSIWGSIGPGMILFLAGLQGISETYYEAAQIDGAGALAKFRYITVPLVSPVTFFSIVLGLIGALQTFDAVYIATNGGPRYATLTMGLFIFQNAFTLLRFGYASAIAWVLAVIIFGLTLIQFRLQSRWVHYGG